MTTRDLVGYLLFPMVLIALAWAIQSLKLWGYIGNETIPWLCSSIALSLLILGSVGLVLRRSPDMVPHRVVLAVYCITVLVLGVAHFQYGDQVGDETVRNQAILEWVYFSIVLLVTMLLTRVKASRDS